LPALSSWSPFRQSITAQRCSEKGDGCSCFYGGKVTDWLDRIVKVPTLRRLTVEQWVEEFEKLKKLNRHVLKPARKEKRRP
jgi:hypothetical protein